MKYLLTLLLAAVFSSVAFSQSEVKIGEQTWMTRNLDVSTFRNGDVIPEAKSDKEWLAAGKNKQPAWCYFKNDPANGTKYGKLYNWYAVNNRRGLAPAGYHVPSEAEYKLLSEYLGGSDIAGKKMKSKSGWAENGNGTNSSGFSGLPGGYRDGGGAFWAFGSYSCWWTSTEQPIYAASSQQLYYIYGGAYIIYSSKEDGFSVRCIKD